MGQGGKQTALYMINTGFCTNAMSRALIYRLAIRVYFAIKFYIRKFKQKDPSILRQQLSTKRILLKIIPYWHPCMRHKVMQRFMVKLSLNKNWLHFWPI